MSSFLRNFSNGNNIQGALAKMAAAIVASAFLFGASGAAARCFVAVSAKSQAGSSSAAKHYAKQNWFLTVRQRYGKPWANWKNAKAKSVICYAHWADTICRVRAIPCRTARRATPPSKVTPVLPKRPKFRRRTN